MLGDVCYWIFNMSIIASFMGLLVCLIRRIRFIPHRVSVYLWIIPFVRMCLPLGINSPYSLMSLLSRLTVRTVTVYEPAEDIAISRSRTRSVSLTGSLTPRGSSGSPSRWRS